MELICLFFPACVAMGIRCRRIEKLQIVKIPELIFKWTGWVVIINLIVMGIITYIFGMDGIVSDAFNSFSFFMKYVLIAIAFSLFLPYLVEILEKYFEMSIKIGEQDEEK